MSMAMPVAAAAIPMAVSMTLALACPSVPAHADFLYVPAGEPAERAAGAGAAAGRGPEPPAAGVHEPGRPDPGAPEPGRQGWQVHAGETLREALGRWGARAGVEVLFLTDRRYRLHEGRTFAGSFEDAAGALFAALSHLPHPPAGAARPGGGTLVVMHQASLHRAGLHRASWPRADGDGR